MTDYQERTNKRIEEILNSVSDTRIVSVGYNNLNKTADFFKKAFKIRETVIICDKNTYAAAGKIVNKYLSDDSELNVLDPFILKDKIIPAEYKYVKIIEEFLKTNNAVPVAIGSGTINDLVKLASAKCGREYMIIPTAASVDGYTSYGASITKDNYKQTIDCPAPASVMVDIGVIASAPLEMNSAGYADLIAKIPAGADWIIADALGIDSIHEKGWGAVQNNLRKWIANPEGIKNNDKEALTGLMEGLLMSGFAMQIAQSSRPASGAEHLFSHVLDNMHYTFNGKKPLHGIKVGIGSVAVEKIYENLLKKDENDIGLYSIRNNRPEWESIEKVIRGYFPDESLAEQVIKQSRKKYIDIDDFTARWKYLKLIWPDLKEKLNEQLYGSENLKDALKKAGSLYIPMQIGIDKVLMSESFIKAQLLRERYTVLDLIYEAGWWSMSVDQLW